KNNTSTRLNVNENCTSTICREIDIIVSRLSKNADSLILDVDNNICEQLNSTINKFLGGKRINFSQKSSYTTRVNAAVISFNSREYLRAIKKHVTNTSPDKRNVCQKRRKILKTIPKTAKTYKKSTTADKYYGNADELDNIRSINNQDLINEMNAFIRVLDDVDRSNIEIETRDQAVSEKWKRERLSRLTASNFGRICKMRPSTSCKNTVYSILYNNFSCKSVEYGRDMENIAKQYFEDMYNFQIVSCGLFIDMEYSFLAASPDGIIDNNAIVEIKAPYAAKDTLNINE
ncbi:Exonuclease, partial [Aphis craccivora]